MGLIQTFCNFCVIVNNFKIIEHTKNKFRKVRYWNERNVFDIWTICYAKYRFTISVTKWRKIYVELYFNFVVYRSWCNRSWKSLTKLLVSHSRTKTRVSKENNKNLKLTAVWLRSSYISVVSECMQNWFLFRRGDESNKKFQWGFRPK